MKNVIAINSGFAEEQYLSWLWFIHPSQEFETDDAALKHFGEGLIRWFVAGESEQFSSQEAVRGMLYLLNKGTMNDLLSLWPEKDTEPPYAMGLPDQMDGWELVMSLKAVLQDPTAIVVVGDEDKRPDGTSYEYPEDRIVDLVDAHT